MFGINISALITTEIQNSRTLHLLVMRHFVIKLTMQGMSNMKADTNIFDKYWRLTDKAMISSLVVGGDINCKYL